MHAHKKQTRVRDVLDAPAHYSKGPAAKVHRFNNFVQAISPCNAVKLSADQGVEANIDPSEPGLGKLTGHFVEENPICRNAEALKTLVTKSASLLSSRTFRVEEGLSYDHSGRYAAVGPFEYAG